MRYRGLPLLLTLLALLALPLPAVANELPDQTIVFYNARIAQREDRSTDVLKLWLLRNSLQDLGQKPTHDDDFESVVWAAMGELGTCPDGFSRDHDGAGLWPLAMHNWVLQVARRGKAPPMPKVYGAFEVDRQARKVSLKDVLTESELRTVKFIRTNCLAAYPYLLETAEIRRNPLRDRRVAASMMRRMLIASIETLDEDKILSTAAIEARLFDLDLAIIELERREAARQGIRAKRRAQMLGVTEVAADEVRAAIQPQLGGDSHQKKLLRRSLTWSVDDWMSLSRSRRLFLFHRAIEESEDPVALDRLMLGMIDDRIAQKQGAELELWIGTYGADHTARRATLFAGDRGARLVDLDRASTGFRERSIVALHRGVDFLAAGEMEEALRAFAFAMDHASESRKSSETLALSRRWLSYTLSRFETNEDVLALVQALVPKQEYNAVIDDFVWRAALRADNKSFERAVAGMRRGSSFDLKISRLRLLSQGRAGGLAGALRRSSVKEPNLTLRFIGDLIEQIEAEEASVRSANTPMLKELIRVLDPLTATQKGRRKSSARRAEQHLIRIHSILEGLHQLDALTPAARARTHSPSQSTYAGAIRLAPADELPWPFYAPEPESPSVFTPLALDPVEWHDDNGKLVFGWRISDAQE